MTRYNIEVCCNKVADMALAFCNVNADIHCLQFCHKLLFDEVTLGKLHDDSCRIELTLLINLKTAGLCFQLCVLLYWFLALFYCFKAKSSVAFWVGCLLNERKNQKACLSDRR